MLFNKMILTPKDAYFKVPRVSLENKRYSTSQKLFWQVPQIIWSWEETSTYCYQRIQDQYLQFHFQHPGTPLDKGLQYLLKGAIIPQLTLSASPAIHPLQRIRLLRTTCYSKITTAHDVFPFLSFHITSKKMKKVKNINPEVSLATYDF